MTKVAISPVQTEDGHVLFNAIAGNKHTNGRTVGEALDALNEQLDDNERGTLIIIQNYRPDNFFGLEQQERLGSLMEQWRSARDSGNEFPPKKQEELDSLVESELIASAKRAKKLSNELN